MYKICKNVKNIENVKQKLTRLVAQQLKRKCQSGASIKYGCIEQEN